MFRAAAVPHTPSECVLLGWRAWERISTHQQAAWRVLTGVCTGITYHQAHGSRQHAVQKCLCTCLPHLTQSKSGSVCSAPLCTGGAWSFFLTHTHMSLRVWQDGFPADPRQRRPDLIARAHRHGAGRTGGAAHPGAAAPEQGEEVRAPPHARASDLCLVLSNPICCLVDALTCLVTHNTARHRKSYSAEQHPGCLEAAANHLGCMPTCAQRMRSTHI